MQRSPSSNSLVLAYDIIVMICAYIKDPDLAGLLTVSRGFFRCVVPRIWRRLPDAQPLLSLIPTECFEAKTSAQLIDLPEDESWLARFDLYAPFVKQLHLEPSSNNKEPNWRSISNAVARRPLLPNLCQLILDVASKLKYLPRGFGSSEDLEGINAFISPSLLDIRLPSGLSSWLVPNTASRLLKNIVDTAELKVLHIYVHVGMGNPDSAFQTLSRFQHLRALKCTTAMVDCEKLRLLGTLPRLESLQIVSPGEWHVSEDEDEDPPGNWVLPATSFPMLRHLSAHELPDSMIVRFWRLTSFIQPLVSLGAKFRSETSSQDVICNIFKGSPRLQELSLDLSDLNDPEVPAAAIDHIKKLPLQRLRILGPDINELTPLTLDMVNLEYLELDNYAYLTIDDMISIAKHMPKLRFLSLGYLNFDRSWELESWNVESDLATPSPSTLCLVAEFRFNHSFMDWKLFGKGSTTTEEIFGFIAQSLCTLWPRGVQCEDVRPDFILQRSADAGHLRTLNQKIVALNRLEGLELQSSESCRSSWMYEF
ncbi:hypothetical protein FS749_007978 [Ceratobasidium sp. UAMH 11750]|nr:hypothetical protein FS749_007978 [Ceratobasidium sp. UAMH 11750]